MKIDRFSMGDRNLGSESRFGPYENFENFKTALIWTPRVELTSYYENIVLCYKRLFLRRFLELRLSVFFGKKSEIFKTLRKNFERGLEVRRGRRASYEERKKKVAQKLFLAKIDLFFRGFWGPRGLATLLGTLQCYQTGCCQC